VVVYAELVEYLVAKARASEAALPFEGCNRVVWAYASGSDGGGSGSGGGGGGGGAAGAV
jgi:hypothetical protein